MDWTSGQIYYITSGLSYATITPCLQDQERFAGKVIIKTQFTSQPQRIEKVFDDIADAMAWAEEKMEKVNESKNFSTQMQGEGPQGHPQNG